MRRALEGPQLGDELTAPIDPGRGDRELEGRGGAGAEREAEVAELVQQR